MEMPLGNVNDGHTPSLRGVLYQLLPNAIVWISSGSTLKEDTESITVQEPTLKHHQTHILCNCCMPNVLDIEMIECSYLHIKIGFMYIVLHLVILF